MIPPRSVFFGTKGKMSWIKAPAINVGMSKGKWTSSGVMLNGGAYELSSNYAHRKFDFAWNLMSPEEVRKITRYFDGIYGDELLYYLDPFAMNSNVLPLSWSVPMLAADDAPPLILDQVPTLSTVATNTNDLPVRAATYTLSAGYVSDTVFIPVPDGEGLNIGVVGSRTGTAAVTFTPKTGSAVSPTLTGIGSTNLITNYMTNTGGGVTVSLTGLGTITLVAMQARVSPSEVPFATVTTNYFTNPRMTTSGSTFEARRNLQPNPAARVSASFTTTAGTSVTRTAEGSDWINRVVVTGSGSTAARTATGVSGIPVTVGSTYTSSFDVKSNGANRSVGSRVSWYNSAGTLVTTTSVVFAPTTGTYVRYSTTQTAPATAAFAQQIFWIDGSVTGDSFDVKNLMFEQASSALPFFDGVVTPDSDYVPSWTGTANASASVLTGTRVASVTGGIKSAQWSSPSLRVDAGQTATVTLGTAGTVFTALARNSGQVLTLGSTSVTSTAAGQRITVTSPTASTAVTFGPGWWDNAGTTSPYFDGATAATSDTTYAWTGTVDASTSTKTVTSPSPNAKQGFIPGEGHSGLRLSGVANISGYSAPSALNLQSISATLTEVGAWEPQ